MVLNMTKRINIHLVFFQLPFEACEDLLYIDFPVCLLTFGYSYPDVWSILLGFLVRMIAHVEIR